MDIIPHISVLTIFVAFLHELGHAFGAIITGGGVVSLQVNPDGSGVCTTSGGIRSVVEASGYLGSILFGNVLVYIGIKHNRAAKILLYCLGWILLISSFVWFSTWYSLMYTSVAGLLVLFFTAKVGPIFSKVITVLVGIYSVIYILIDYNVGPTADLESFSGVVPAAFWMYVWLLIAIGITFANVYFIVRRKKHG